MSQEIHIARHLDKKTKYEQLIPQLESLISDETDLIANMANLASVLKENFNFLWVGFYRNVNNELILGPFQGPLACTRIAIGKGVCGTAAQKKETIIVPNVDQFPGHIACSSLSKSEIVVPKILNNKLIYVLDIDSEQFNHFDQTDADFLEKILQKL